MPAGSRATNSQAQVLLTTAGGDPSTWVIDSGATHHFTNDISIPFDEKWLAIEGGADVSPTEWFINEILKSIEGSYFDQNLNDIKGYGDSLLNNEINKRKENIKNEAMNEISNRIFK